MKLSQQKNRSFVFHLLILGLTLLSACILTCTTNDAIAAEIKANPSTSFLVPVHLDSSQAIYSVDIRVQFDHTLLKAVGATLAGTILEGRGYQLVQNVGLVGEARFPVYSSSNLHTGSGIVLYIELEPLGVPGDQTLLELSRFRCNEIQASGGFYIQNDSMTSVSVVINAPPVAYDQSVETLEDNPITLTLTGQDSDTADILSYTLSSSPSLGSVDLSEISGQLVYTPYPDISGTDIFTYRTYDGTAFSAPAYITILIRSGNDFPIAKPSSISTDEDTPISFSLSGIDPDNDPITYKIEIPPDEGELELLDAVSGSCRYTPEINAYGQYTFSFVAMDDYGSSEAAQVTINIIPINDAPVASPASYTLYEDEPFSFKLQASDIDSSIQGFQIIEQTQFGTVEITNEQTGDTIFTPKKDHYGEVWFSFVATDGISSSETVDVQFTILPVNDRPIALAGTVSINEDFPEIFYVTGTDTEDDPLSYSIQTLPEQGTLVLNTESGECLYTPVAEYSGMISFSFSVFDGKEHSDPSAFTIVVLEVNDPPVAEHKTITTPEDEPIFFALKATDIDSDVENYVIQDPPIGDILVMDAVSGLCKYTPEANFFGQDSFTFIAKDSENASEPAQITIIVTPVNDAPIAESMSITGNEDRLTDIQLLASDADGDTLTFTLLSTPNHGQLLNLDITVGTAQYLPDTDYYGSDQFVFEVTDGLKSGSAVVSIDIHYVNDPPFVHSDIITVKEEGSLEYTLLAYDEDSEITGYQISRYPEHGELILTDEQKGFITYAPFEDFFGADSFEFKAMDDFSASDAAVVSINVTGVNDLPVGYPKTFELDEDYILNDKLSFDDPDYDMLTITVFTPASHGILTITDRRTGAFTYTPTANYFGTDNIVFEACDMAACSGPSSMTFIINPINDPPVVLPLSLTLTEDQPMRITLTAYDVENNITGFEIIEYPQGLIEEIDSEKGIFLYTPDQDATGIDSFQYQAADESSVSNPAMISLNIIPVNDSPEGTASAYTMLEDEILEGTLEKFDPDGDAITLTVKTLPEHGWVTAVNPITGEFSYKPASNYNGIDTFWYVVCDSSLCSDETLITLNITPVNDLPVVSSNTYELAEDTPLQLTLVGNDVEESELIFEITESPQMGDIVLINTASGICVYTPFSQQYGSDQFSYRVYDGHDYSEPAQIELNIYSVNDLPIALAGEIEMLEDQSFSGKVEASDADGDDLIFTIYQTPKKGKVVLSSSGAGQGSFVYTPYLNANGMDVFWFQVFDGEAYSDPQPMTVNITPVNDAPQADDAMFFINAGEEQEWILNASDAEADAITFVIVQQPEKGTVELIDINTGTFRFMASGSAGGSDTITFKVSDGKLYSNEATIAISVNPAGNHQPVAKSLMMTVTEGIASYFTIEGSDEDNNKLNYIIYQQPSKGTFSFTNDNTGESVYESFLNAQGMDRVVYYVNDGIVNSEPAFLTIVIQPMPQTVVAKQKILSVPIVLNEEKTIESMNIQVQFDSSKLSISGLSLDNTVLSQGDYGFSTQIGTDGFAGFPLSSQGAAITTKGVVAYVLFDILGNEGDETLLTLSLFTCNETRAFGGFQVDDAVSSKIRLIVNEMPSAYDGYLVIDEDQSLDYYLIGYDVNMTDPISYTIVSYPEKGQLTLINAITGECHFSANPNANGSDSFIYKAFDGKDYSEPANIQITIHPINDKPTAFPVSMTTLEDIPKSITLSGEDLADPNDMLIFKFNQKPSNGVAIIDPMQGICMYQGNENFYGQDTFTYVVDDGIEKSDPAVVNIIVTAVNDAPVAQPFTKTTAEDTNLEFDLVATDAENDLFEFAVSRNPSFGSLSLNPINGHCSYEPNNSFNGTDYFEFKVTDINSAASAPVRINIVVTPENDAPVVASQSIKTNEDESYSGTLEATDPDQDTVTFLIVTEPEQGNLTLTPETGEFIYTPKDNYNGNDFFVVAAKDTWVTSDNVSITVDILPMNDAPTANAGTSYQLTERNEIVLDGSQSTDIDGDTLSYLWTAPDIPNLVITNANTVNPTFKAPYVDESGQTINVTLTVKDSSGESDQSTAAIKIDNMALPEVSFSANPYTGMVPLNVAFFDQSTGMPERWTWDFGDGTTSTKQKPEHVYTSSGVYTVKLTVEGPGGESSNTRTDYINVSYQALNVDFSVDPSEGTVPHTVTFTPAIQGEVNDWKWDFGDGIVSYDYAAEHTYQETGSYTVTLTASGPGGSDEKTYENLIQVDGHVIRGQVVAKDTSTPLAGYRVEVHNIDTFVAGTVTDESGQYIIEDLMPSSKYVVSAWPPEGDTQYLYQYYDGAQSLYDASYVTTNVITVVNFSLEASPKSWISGQITDGTDPISGIQVDIYSDQLSFGQNTTTDEKGVYTITGLKTASDYRVSVYSSDLDKEFFFVMQDGGTVGEDTPEMSAMNSSQATLISPSETGLKNIDIIVNLIQGAAIEGNVVDSQGSPIVGMRVNAWSDTLKLGGNATTDDNGHYKILGLTPVSSTDAETKGYIVEIQPNGYIYQVYNQATDRNNAQPVYTGRTDIDFTLVDNSSISGTVTDISGNPVSNGTVRIYSQSNPTGNKAETLTDTEGKYELNNLPVASDYIISIDVSGYPLHYYKNQTSLDDASSVDLQWGSLQNVDFALDKGPVIQGQIHILTFGSQAPENTKVTLRSDTLGMVRTVFTNNNGEFQFTGLDDSVSDYIISVISDDYLPAYYRDNENGDNTDDTTYVFSEALAVNALDENSAPQLHLVLMTGLSITGLVHYENAPVSDAIVQIKSDSGTWETTTTDGPTVNYTLTGLLPGIYEIKVLSDLYETQSVADVSIQADVTGQDIQLTDLPRRTIQGTVYNLETGKQIQIVAKSQSKDIQKTVTLVGSGSSMNYMISDLLPASDYILELQSSDYANQYYENAYQVEDAKSIDISDNDITDIDFTITIDLTSIEGTLTFPDDATNGDKVRLEVKSSSTGIEGFTEREYAGSTIVSYSITGLLPSNDYVLQLRSDTYQNRYWDASDKGTAQIENAVKIDTNSGSAQANFILDEGVSLGGQVKDSNGEPLSGIQIEVWSDRAKIQRIAQTSETGDYQVKGLAAADDYKVKATTSTNALFYYNSSSSVRILKDASTISTHSGNVENINITISKGVSIEGKIASLSGQAISGIWVNAWSESNQVGSGVFSSDDGSYKILDLPEAQDYVVSAKPEWNMPYQAMEQSSVTAPSTAIDLQLSPKVGFTVTGKVTGPSGSAVKKAVIEIRSASKPENFGWTETDFNGDYTIDLLPKGTDYKIEVKPPETSSHAYYNNNLSIEENTQWDIMLDTGYVFSGTVVEKATQNPIKEAVLSVWSETTRFYGESTADSNGNYQIGNVPMASDYQITVKISPYLDYKASDQSPKTNTIRELENGGLIKGIVRSSLTGSPIPEASIEIYSQANQGLEVYNGVATTDKDGNYSVSGLKPVDEQGNMIDDFVVTAFAVGFPPMTKTGKKLGDTVSFDISKGPENEMSGTIQNAGNNPVAIDVFEITFVNQERTDKFIKTIMANSDGSFTVDGLRATGKFILKFVTLVQGVEYAEWAGVDDKGVLSDDDAKQYETESTIAFSYSFISTRKRSVQYASNSGPGPVRNLRSLTHKYKSLNKRLRAAETSGPDKPSNDPNVTVSWEPPEDGSGNISGYYSFFDKDTDKSINKFTTVSKPPIRTRKITSRDLEGDDVSYYFHVAAVDKEGRIGKTTSIAFRIDTTPPTNVQVTAPVLTDDRTIDLLLGATGATEMYVSNVSYDEGGQWENRAVNRVWQLTDGDGSKSIYTRFRDKAGNTANAAAVTVYQPPLPTYLIRAEAGINGSITPEGDITVTQGNKLEFQLIPDDDYRVNQLLLDGNPQTVSENKFVLENIQAPHQVRVTFKEANTAPVVVNETINVTEDQTKTGKLEASDSEQDDMTFTITKMPEKGNFRLDDASNGSFTYIPVKDDNGTYTVQFKVSDGKLDSETGTMTLKIIPVNDLPQVIGKVVETDVNTAIDIELTSTDVDNEELTFEIVSQPLHGEVVINDNIATYTPETDYRNNDSFTFKALDDEGESNVGTIKIRVGVPEADLVLDEDSLKLVDIPVGAQIIQNPKKGTLIPSGSNYLYSTLLNQNGSDSIVYKDGDETKEYTIYINDVNDLPVFTSPKNYTVKEDNVLKIQITADDVDEDVLTFEINGSPKNGQLDGILPSLTYTPAQNFNGTDTFQIRVSDNFSSITQNVNIIVESINDAPIAKNQSLATDKNTPIILNLTATDVDVTDELTYTILSETQYGTLNGSNNSWTFTPATDQWGLEEIQFIVNDGHVDSQRAVIYLYVGIPIVHAFGEEDEAIDLRAGLSKFFGVNADEQLTIKTSPENGTLNGTLTQYQGNPNVFGKDEFTFTSNTYTEPQTFKLFIVSVNDAPEITAANTVETDEDHEVSIVFKVTDIDSSNLTYSLLVEPKSGSLSGTAPSYTFVPDANFYGEDQIMLQVSDGALSDQALVKINVNPINDAPVANAQSVKLLEDSTLDIVLTGTDIEDIPLSYAITKEPTYGELSGNAPDIVYTPFEDYNGNDSFTFTVNDGQLTSNDATIQIRIENVNDLPQAVASSITITESGSASGVLRAYDNYFDRDMLIYSIQEYATKGTVVITNPVSGAFTYYSNALEVGMDYFTFKVNDGYADSNTASVMVTISTPIEDLISLKMNMLSPYDEGDSYHYSI
ncbi:secreted protein containing PKD domain protein, partial [Candidatus Magnetomorum sp. HK-1]